MRALSRCSLSLAAVVAVLALSVQGARAQTDGEEELLRQYRTVEHRARTLIHFDYRLALAQASQKRHSGLCKLFWFTGTEACKGSAAHEHGDVLRAMLHLWGDDAFSGELAKEPPPLRHAVILAIEQVWPAPGWRPSEYSKTYSIVKHAK